MIPLEIFIPSWALGSAVSYFLYYKFECKYLGGFDSRKDRNYTIVYTAVTSWFSLITLSVLWIITARAKRDYDRYTNWLSKHNALGEFREWEMKNKKK